MNHYTLVYRDDSSRETFAHQFYVKDELYHEEDLNRAMLITAKAIASDYVKGTVTDLETLSNIASYYTPLALLEGKVELA